MTKVRNSSERNLENIRRKNLEDNQVFLQELLMNDIRTDFVNSARSILRIDGNNQTKKKLSLQQQKIEHTTRYNEKVKSGLIGPFVPEWQRLIDEKKKEAEKRRLEKEQKKLENEQKRQQNEMKKQEILFEKELRKWEMEENKEKRLFEKELRKRKMEENKEERLFEKDSKQIERELIREEKLAMRRARRRPPKPSPWALYYQNSLNGNPYQRSFIPRQTKVGERVEQNHINLVKLN